jgi:hypothetical protein
MTFRRPPTESDLSESGAIRRRRQRHAREKRLERLRQPIKVVDRDEHGGVESDLTDQRAIGIDDTGHHSRIRLSLNRYDDSINQSINKIDLQCTQRFEHWSVSSDQYRMRRAKHWHIDDSPS